MLQSHVSQHQNAEKANGKTGNVVDDLHHPRIDARVKASYDGRQRKPPKRRTSKYAQHRRCRIEGSGSRRRSNPAYARKERRKTEECSGIAHRQRVGGRKHPCKRGPFRVSHVGIAFERPAVERIGDVGVNSKDQQEAPSPQLDNSGMVFDPIADRGQPETDHDRKRAVAECGTHASQETVQRPPGERPAYTKQIHRTNRNGNDQPNKYAQNDIDQMVHPSRCMRSTSADNVLTFLSGSAAKVLFWISLNFGPAVA